MNPEKFKQLCILSGRFSTDLESIGLQFVQGLQGNLGQTIYPFEIMGHSCAQMIIMEIPEEKSHGG
jgi:hypothetical protein